MIRSIVTGAAGFIGSHLVDKLMEMSHDVIAIDNLATGNFENLKNKNVTFIDSDISIKGNWMNHFENVDYVFHLAALADIVPSINNPEKYFNTNVIGTSNVVNSCRRSVNLKKIIYSASSSCYGIPKSYPTDENAAISPQYPYALTKRLGEEILLHWAMVYKLPFISLRLFNVYGLRARTSSNYGAVFGVFLSQKINNAPYTVVGDGSQTRDFTFVSDVVQAMYDCSQSTINYDVFNIGSGRSVSINDIVKLLGGDFVNIPKRPGEPEVTYADISKIKKLIGWSPKISIEEGVGILKNNLSDWKKSPLWTPESIEKETADWFRFLQK